jgi:hypothetical protein
MGILIHALGDLSRALTARLEEDAALLTAIGWGRGQAAGHRGQTPFLDVAFDEDESHLTKVDVNGTGSVGANRGEEVL